MCVNINNVQNFNSLWPVLCPVFCSIRYDKGDDTELLIFETEEE